MSLLNKKAARDGGQEAIALVVCIYIERGEREIDR